MIYVINKKNYILVSGYFKEVEVNKKGKDDYEVIPVKGSTPIEASTVKEFTTTSVEAISRKKDIFEDK